MAKGILGRKVGTTQIYEADGTVVPVTVVQAGPCCVLQIRTVERDGYEAVQLGFDDKKRERASRSERGHVAKISSKRSRSRAASGVELDVKPDCEPKHFIREFRGSADGLSVGQEIRLADVFETSQEREERLGAEEEAVSKKKPCPHVNDKVKIVDVIGLSKGRGYAGVMKRHNFHGQRATHGVKKVHRHAGGTGCSASPSRTVKGRKMSGQYGNARITVRNLKVVRIDEGNDLLLIRGAVPGPNGGYLVIRETNKLG